MQLRPYQQAAVDAVYEHLRRANAEEMRSKASDRFWAEYVYLFRDGRWYVNTTYRPSEWRLVEEVLKERNNG